MKISYCNIDSGLVKILAYITCSSTRYQNSFPQEGFCSVTAGRGQLLTKSEYN